MSYEIRKVNGGYFVKVDSFYNKDTEEYEDEEEYVYIDLPSLLAGLATTLK